MAASVSSLAILPSSIRGSGTKNFDLRLKPTNSLVLSVSSSSNYRQNKPLRVLASVSVSDPAVRSNTPDDLVASILSKVMAVLVNNKSFFF